MENIHIREVRSDETDLLDEIFKFRVLCRNEEGYITFAKYPDGWKDEYDVSAVHFAAFHDDRLVGAARINYYNTITEHPYYPAFEKLQGFSLDQKIGYLSRIVVHPLHRHEGISKQLVEKREVHARQQNQKNLFADVSGFQIDNFTKYGYKNAGYIDTSKIKWSLNPDHCLMYKCL